MSLVASRLQLVPRPLDPGVIPDTLTHAYSTKRIRSGYVGPCLRVRRASDNAEQDVGFVAGQLDTAALLQFCGSSDGYVTTWYSQLPGVGNATQAVAEFQPRICTNGVVDTLGTSLKPALSFPNPERQLIPPNEYIATASSTFSVGSFGPGLAFDRSPATFWASAAMYNASTGAYTGAVSTTIDGTALLGEWFQVVLPNAVVVASLGIFPRSGVLTQSPKQFTLAASADGGTTWTALYRATSASYAGNTETRFLVNSTRAYSTYRVVIDANFNNEVVSVSGCSLYGMFAELIPKEVSLVPFMNFGEAHGSYVADKSSTFNQSSYNAAKVFDSDAASQWISAATYTSGTGVYTGTVTTTVSGTSYAGEWVQITFPSAVLCQKLGLMSSTGTRLPKTFTLAGTNDGGTTWTLLYRNTSVPAYTNNVETLFQFPSTITFSTYRLICEDIGGSGTQAWINSLKLYGYEPPLTFMDVPSASSPLAVVGGMAPIYEQQLVPASGYTATASSEYSSSLYPIKRVFDRSPLAIGWLSALTYAVGTGLYTGSVSTAVNGVGTVLGEWAQVALPAGARLTSYSLYAQFGFPGRCPRDLVVVGSNDNGTSWNLVDARTDIPLSGYVYGRETNFRVARPTTSYATYRFIATKVFTVNANSFSFNELVLYGVYDAPPAAQALVPAMTADSHGWYVVNASSQRTSSEKWRAFDTVSPSTWSSSTIYSSGNYIGAVSTTLDTGSASGEYVEILFPNPVRIVSYSLRIRTGLEGRGPASFTLAHSTTRGSSWTFVEQRTGFTSTTWLNNATVTFTLATPLTTSALRIIIHTIAFLDIAEIEEWGVHGYELPTFITSASSTNTNAAATLVPSSLLAGSFLAAPPGSSLSEILGVSSAAPSTALQTITQRVYSPPSSQTYKLTRTQPTSTNAAYALDALSTHAKASIGAAFSVRRLLTQYRGPLLKIRRSSDNLEQDWYGNPDVLDAFLAGGQVGYVAIWYDQSGLGKHATAPTTAEQPRLAKDRGRYVVHFDGLSFASSRYLTFPAVTTQSVWSQFMTLVTPGTGLASSIIGSTLAENGLDFESRNLWRFLLNVTGSVAYLNTAKYTNTGTALNILPLQEWNGFLGIRNNSSQIVNTIARHYRSSIGTSYRDFNGTMADLVLFTGAPSDTDAAALYASRAVKESLKNTHSRGVFKGSLYGSAALIASLTDSAKRILMEGRLTRDAADLVTLGSELARLGPSLATPISSPVTLRLNGVTWPVPFDYVIKRSGSLTITSGYSAADFFSSVVDTRPAVVVIDGNLTIDANATFTPPVRKLFTVLYVTGDLTINGTISMTARGANHSGTGSSGGYVAPQNILILNGTRDGVSSPNIPATGGTGAVGYGAGGLGNTGGASVLGGSGGGGAGGNGGGIVGNGSAGTSFTGGTGGGASFNAYNGQTGEPFGGAGGLNFNGEIYSGRGAGNPDTGTGGTLIVYVVGLITGSGSIVSNGSAASGGGTGGAGVLGGGGSGGGAVTVLASSGGELVGVTATGGGRAQSRSGLGGDGSARLLRTLAGPVISARVRDLATLTAGAAVSTWGSWTSASPNQPTYQLGTDSKYEVAFDRTLGQYMDGGSRTFNFGTNEGFTFVTHFKFTGTANTNEAIFASGPVITGNSGSNSIQIFRGTNGLRILAQDNTGTFIINLSNTSARPIAQDTWVVAAFRYRRVAGTGYCQILQNNVLDTEQNMGAVTVSNRTNQRTYIGKSYWNETNGFTGSMRFAGMWDRALTDAELTGLYTSLTS